MPMNNWDILGIEPTDDLNIIKKAYAEKSRLFHPETYPEEFQKLHKAYKELCRSARFHVNYRSTYVPYNPADYSDGHDVIDEDDEELPDNDAGNYIADTDYDDDYETAESSASDTDADRYHREYDDVLAKIESVSQGEERRKNELFGLAAIEDMLSRQTGVTECYNYFTSEQFLDNQYNPEYISLLAETLHATLCRFDPKTRYVGNCPKYMFTYIIIAYGCLFPALGSVKINEPIYNSGVIEPLSKTLRLYAAADTSYRELEQDVKFIGERFSFYVYRNILDMLDKVLVDRNALSQWIAWGFANEHRPRLYDICHCIPRSGPNAGRLSARYHTSIPRSPVIFRLMTYLVIRSRTPMLFIDVLFEVCESFMMTPECCEEITELHSLCKSRLQEQD